ncbi:MAG TPA: M48 family peptidase, partial [Methylomirabilota bacterium]|nr:M48 family peptidase [Methylomirabilota bacterium]
MNRIAGLVGVPVVALVMIACSSTTEQGTVGVERSQFLLVSSAEMDKSAAAAYAQVIQEQSPKGNVNK